MINKYDERQRLFRHPLPHAGQKAAQSYSFFSIPPAFSARFRPRINFF